MADAATRRPDARFVVRFVKTVPPRFVGFDELVQRHQNAARRNVAE